MSSSTTLEEAVKKQKNDAYVKAFKKASGTKKQTVMPTAAAQHTEWAVHQGWSMQDAITWRGICEKAKFARDDVESSAWFAVICDTIDVAAHCQTHPIGLIHFGRTSMGLKNWDMDAIEFLKDNLLTTGEGLCEDGGNPEEVDQDEDIDDKELANEGSLKRPRRSLTPVCDDKESELFCPFEALGDDHQEAYPGAGGL